MSRPFGRGDGPSVSLVVPVTPMVRRLMAALTAIYLCTVLMATLAPPSTFIGFWSSMSLVHAQAFGDWHLWSLFTYGWLHDLGRVPLLDVLVCGLAAYGIVRLYRTRWARSEFFLFVLAVIASTMLLQALGFGAPMHLLGNVVMLYFFGHLFEDRWGPRRFLFFWSLCVVGGGLLSTAMWYVLPEYAGGSVVGASAGAMGLLAAYAVYFPNQTVLYGLVVPIKGKYFLYIAVVFDLIGLVGHSGVAVFAHFGGILTALLLTTGYWRPSKLKRAVNRRRPPKKPHLRVVRPSDDDDDPPRYLH